ncbi:MAG: EscE/YscE/SsaE family type III secretion system needle protein co-chaperone [Pseudomonadota bacterium]
MKERVRKNADWYINMPKSEHMRSLEEQYQLLRDAQAEAQRNMRKGCSHKDYAQWQELLLAVETAIRVVKSEF